MKMTEKIIDRIVWWARIGGNVIFYGLMLAFMVSCAALLSYLEPIKEMLLP